MRTLVGLALVAALALAGCASSSNDSSSSSSETGPAATSHGSATSGTTSGHATTGTSGTGTTTGGTTSGTSGSSGNHAPVGTITVHSPGGAVPFNVTFTLTGTDADHDPLSWTLDANADGKPDLNQSAPATMPATVQYQYTTAGLFNVTYTLSDGKVSSTYHTLVNATGTAVAGITLSGHIDEADPAAVASQGCTINAITLVGGPGAFGDTFDLPAEVLKGGTFTVTPASLEVDFYDSGYSNYLGGGSGGSVPVGSAQATTCGTDPAAPNFDYTVTIFPA